MTYRRRVLVVAAASALVIALAACGGDGGGNSEEGGSTTIGGMAAELHGTKDVSNETGKVEIELYDDYFEPTILEGKPGQKVTLELKNEGDNPHTLTISDQEVDQEVQPGDEAEAHVTFPQSGQLAFVCRFHESNGMVGALEVSASPAPTTTTPSTTTTPPSDY
jgi:plastocyanin